MEGLWERLHEELEESTWNDPDLSSPSGLPERAETEAV